VLEHLDTSGNGMRNFPCFRISGLCIYTTVATHFPKMFYIWFIFLHTSDTL